MYEINVPNTETISSCSSFLVLWSICLTWIIFNLLWLEAISCNVYYQRNTLTDPWAVADPRFSRRGAPTPDFRVKTYYLTRFLLKTAWKWKKLDVGMCFPSAPLGSANGEGGPGMNPDFPHISSGLNAQKCVIRIQIHQNTQFLQNLWEPWQAHDPQITWLHFTDATNFAWLHF